MERAMTLTAVYTLIRPNELRSLRTDKSNFTRTTEGAQLSDNKIHLSLKAILSYIGPAQFGLYSFKHAAMTYLVKMNVPEAYIAQAARYKDKSQPSVIGKYYARTEAVKKIQILLSQAVENREIVDKYQRKEILKKLKKFKKAGLPLCGDRSREEDSKERKLAQIKGKGKKGREEETDLETTDNFDLFSSEKESEFCSEIQVQLLSKVEEEEEEEVEVQLGARIQIIGNDVLVTQSAPSIVNVFIDSATGSTDPLK
jgi:hypothetical protein